MTEEHKRKKQSEKLSNSFAARLTRDMGTSDRLSAMAAEGRASDARVRDVSKLASMQSRPAHSFKRCPHCREFVPIREHCRSCGAPIS
jgi:uncharacterized protein with PIN domain